MILIKCAWNVVGAAVVAAATALSGHKVYNLQCIAYDQPKRDALALQWGAWAAELGLSGPESPRVELLDQDMLDAAQPDSSPQDNTAMIRFLVSDIVDTEHMTIFDQLPWLQRRLAEPRLSKADVAGVLRCSWKRTPLRLRVIAGARSGCAVFQFARLRSIATVCTPLRGGLLGYLVPGARLYHVGA